jgi:hypothetical protein
MPSQETLERFVARVESNAHVEACEEFYTEHSTMQENFMPPRVGRDAHVANERKVMARAASIVSKCVRPVFVNGDRVVIRWIFEFEWSDGTYTHGRACISTVGRRAHRGRAILLRPGAAHAAYARGLT